jgi:hypothetical protein
VGANGLGSDGAWRAGSRLVQWLLALVKVIRLGRGRAIIIDVLGLNLWRVLIRGGRLLLLRREELRGGTRVAGSTRVYRGNEVVIVRIILGL